MFQLLLVFSLPPHDRDQLEVLEQIAEQGDTSQVPILVEVLRFGVSRAFRTRAVEVLQELTDQDYDLYDWVEWMEWLGNNSSDFRPPQDYLAWKVDLLSLIDMGYRELFPPGVKISIDPADVVWGGVPIDGIPDLIHPPMLSAKRADEQGYPGPQDRVFGVSINGDHRAYPLRVANAHEMINDVVGGEPIALAY